MTATELLTLLPKRRRKMCMNCVDPIDPKSNEGLIKDWYKSVTNEIVSNFACGPALQWRHNGHDDVSNHQPHHFLLNRLFRSRSKKTSKLRVTGICAGDSPVPGDFPAHMASDTGNGSIWWRHHVIFNLDRSIRKTPPTPFPNLHVIWYSVKVSWGSLMSVLVTAVPVESVSEHAVIMFRRASKAGGGGGGGQLDIGRVTSMGKGSAKWLYQQVRVYIYFCMDMPSCTGTKVNANDEQIDSWVGDQFRIGPRNLKITFIQPLQCPAC